MPRLTRMLLLLAIGFAQGAGVAKAQDDEVARGAAFAEANCSPCHAVGRDGQSPHLEAPPFRELHTRYPVENLAEALAEGLTTGHPAMPEFELEAADVDDLIAYLKSLER